MKTHRFVGRHRLANHDAALILASNLPLAILKTCSDGGSSEAPESKASHAGKGRRPGKRQSEDGDSSAENESPPDGAASNGERSTDEGNGTTASDRSSGRAPTTPSGSPTGGGSTPGGGKVAGTGTLLLNSPTKTKGQKAGQANSGKILSKNKRGCFLSAGRQRAKGVQDGERKMTEDAVNRHLAKLRQGKSSFHAKSSDRAKLRGTNGAEVDGVANVVTYTDAGGKSYRGWHWLRAFSTSAPAVYALVSYTHPAFTYSESELTKIIEKSGPSVDGDVPGGVVN